MPSFLPAPALADRIRGFWAWFQAHEAALAAVQSPADPVVGAVGDALTRVAAGLGWQMGLQDTDGRREFVLTANGRAAQFPLVAALAAAAPDAVGLRWHIVPLHPRRPLPMVVAYGGLTVPTDTIQVKPTRRGQRIDLVVYLPGDVPADLERYGQVGFLALDLALGEFDVATKIGTVTFTRRSRLPVAGAVPLAALAGVVDRAGGH